MLPSLWEFWLERVGFSNDIGTFMLRHTDVINNACWSMWTHELRYIWKENMFFNSYMYKYIFLMWIFCWFLRIDNWAEGKRVVPRPGKDPSNDAANVRSGLRKNTLINSTCGMYVRVSRNPMSFAMALFCTSCCYRNFQFFISFEIIFTINDATNWWVPSKEVIER